MKTIDGHIHYSLPATYEELITVLDTTHTDYANLVACYDRYRASQTIDCLQAKYLGQGRIFTFGSLDLAKYYTNPQNIGECQKEHVKHLIECGCDGIKMLEGKPTSRNRYKIPDFDLPEWDPFFEYMEKAQVPIVWHVNDPEEFWDIKRVPSWALASGWYYDSNSINNEDQYRQINNILNKHPNIKITFAHFYFLSAQLDRLQAIFDKCPNICVDITPGIEMFVNFSNDLEKARNFFIKNQDRIIYGTDIALEADFDSKQPHYSMKDSIIRYELCHNYLNEKDEMLMKGDEESLLGKDDFTLKPLNLPQEVQEKILYKNFISHTSLTPRKINKNKVLEECARERERIKVLSEIFNHEPNYQAINILEEFFKNA